MSVVPLAHCPSWFHLSPWRHIAQVGKVSGVGGEEERLLTVLYYDLVEKSKRKRKGEPDDDDDDESD